MSTLTIDSTDYNVFSLLRLWLYEIQFFVLFHIWAYSAVTSVEIVMVMTSLVSDHSDVWNRLIIDLFRYVERQKRFDVFFCLRKIVRFLWWDLFVENKFKFIITSLLSETTSRNQKNYIISKSQITVSLNPSDFGLTSFEYYIDKNYH